MMKKSISAVLFFMLLAGCSVKQNPAQTKIDTPLGKVHYKCPPGQAKKGNCQPL